MKDPDSNFKVIIAGGSIAGLTLANMLEAHGIDYVVLEAYPDIAPQVGASIGLIPHGLRILDQLGVYDSIRKLVSPLDKFHFRDSKGTLLAAHTGVAASFIERHGYPMIFLDRQAVLQVLYDNINHKTRVRTSQKVVSVQHKDEGVVVKTSDGNSYEGDLVIGADGIHSVVRTEMWRTANEESPGYIPVDEPKAMPCDYGCIFGISNPCEGINPGDLHSVFRKSASYLVLGGLGSRVFWFYFFNLGKRVHSPLIPRYTKEDEAKLVSERHNDPILPGLKFGDLLKKKISSTMTALPEYVFKKWHYGRMVTVGDSAHKFEPIAGHGGNAAIETSAALINELVKTLDRCPNRKPTRAEITKALNSVQLVRQARAEKLCADSHFQQRFEALESPLLRIMAHYMLPMSKIDDILFNASKNVPSAEKMDTLPVPTRTRMVPFKDELARDPAPRGHIGTFVIASFLSLTALGYWAMHVRTANNTPAWGQVIETGEFPDNRTLLRYEYTGIPAIDNVCRMLVSAFLPGIAAWDPSFCVLELYFLMSLVPVVAIWTIESCRKRNATTFLYLSSLWAALYQLNGIAVFAPIYYAAFVSASADHTYWWPLSREVPLRYSRHVLAALLLGYVLPTVLMFLPVWDEHTLQGLIAFWQPAPIYVNIIIAILGAVHSRKNKAGSTKQTPEGSRKPTPENQAQDLPLLKMVYKVCFGLTAATHAGCVATLSLSESPALSFSHAFGFSSSADWTVTEGLRNLWLADFWVWAAATTLFCLVSAWDLQRVGRSTLSFGYMAAAIACGTIAVGPGAVLSGCWLYRETAMAKTTIPRVK